MRKETRKIIGYSISSFGLGIIISYSFLFFLDFSNIDEVNKAFHIIKLVGVLFIALGVFIRPIKNKDKDGT